MQYAAETIRQLDVACVHELLLFYFHTSKYRIISISYINIAVNVSDCFPEIAKVISAIKGYVLIQRSPVLGIE